MHFNILIIKNSVEMNFQVHFIMCEIYKVPHIPKIKFNSKQDSIL